LYSIVVSQIKITDYLIYLFIIVFFNKKMTIAEYREWLLRIF
jgi:hypothetical protein